jgi:hypothetical protein
MLLREEGFDAVHVLVIGMDCAVDVEIPEASRGEARVCFYARPRFSLPFAASRN